MLDYDWMQHRQRWWFFKGENAKWERAGENSILAFDAQNSKIQIWSIA